MIFRAIGVPRRVPPSIIMGGFRLSAGLGIDAWAVVLPSVGAHDQQHAERSAGACQLQKRWNPRAGDL